MKTYLKSSFELKKLIGNLSKMDPRANLFTYDAELMYTDTPTECALEVISEYVQTNQAKYGHYHAPTLI